jgi:hypothetical protein
MLLVCSQGEVNRKALCTAHWPWLYCTVLMPEAVPPMVTLSEAGCT